MRGKMLRVRAMCLYACALAVMAAGCGGGNENAEVRRPLVEGVTVRPVVPREVGEAFEGTGTVRTDRTSLIASRVMGTVTSLKVREGDYVKAGELLVTIDDRDAAERTRAATMAVESAKVNRDLAHATWVRYRSLFEQKAVTNQEMDQMEAGRKAAEAEYARARAMEAEAATALGFARITAPFPGRVTAKMIDQGSMASPGTPLLTLEGDGDRYVETAVDEGLSGRIKAGLPAEVTVDSLRQTVKGRVREVVPAVDPRSRTFLVKVAVDGQDLRSGLFTRVRIPLGARSALVVPPGAVVAKGQLTGVYAVDPRGVVTYRLIRTGMQYPSGVEVLSGLVPDDRIITSGVEKAVDGGVIPAERH